jgi:hypothetical protein
MTPLVTGDNGVRNMTGTIAVISNVDISISKSVCAYVTVNLWHVLNIAIELMRIRI